MFNFYCIIIHETDETIVYVCVCVARRVHRQPSQLGLSPRLKASLLARQPSYRDCSYIPPIDT
jgi:hypothetical protein